MPRSKVCFFLFFLWVLPASASSFRFEDAKKGSLVLGDQAATIAADQNYKTVLLLWGNLEVHGQVQEMVVVSGKVVFHPGSAVLENLLVLDGSFESRAGSSVAPQKVTFQTPGLLWRLVQAGAGIWQANFSWVVSLFFSSILCVSFWVVAAIFLRFAFFAELSSGLLKDWVANLGVGWLASLMVPAFAGLLVVSLVGVLFLPLLFLLLVFWALLAYVAAAIWAGHRFLPPRGKQTWNKMGVFLGFLAFQFLWQVGVWWAILPILFLWLLAWGAIPRQLWLGRRK